MDRVMMPPGPDERDDGGLEAVLGALQEESFPMDKPDLYYAIGDLALTDGAGGIVSVREVLDRIAKTRFQSADDVADSLRATLDVEAVQTPPDVR
jgi:hypothetical protein